MGIKLAYHITPVGNLNTILKDGLQPRIGERSAELGEKVPRIYLFPDIQSCETALTTWLGACFEDIKDDGLIILKMDVSGLSLDHSVDYELSCLDIIPPLRVLEVLSEMDNMSL